MKKVEAVICASSLGAVMQEVDRFDVSGVTLTELAASGQGWKFRGVDRRSKDPADGLHRLRIEVVVLDAYAGPVAWAIARGARAGPSSDPVVSIEIVEDVVRIRTGERGVAAMSSRSDPSQPDEPHDVAHSRGRSFPVLHGVPNRPTIADWTKVLVTNVVLATAVVVLVFHAPVVYAGLGAAGAGLVLWARERRAQTRRAR